MSEVYNTAVNARCCAYSRLQTEDYTYHFPSVTRLSKYINLPDRTKTATQPAIMANYTYKVSNTSSQRPPGLTLPPPGANRPGPNSTGNMAGLFGSAASSASANPTQGDLSKDVELSSPPEDSISDMCFSPASDHLAVASWDKKVRIYEIDGNGNSKGMALFEHEGPVLNCCWSKVSTPIRRVYR